jgi:hypothetical protein
VCCLEIQKQILQGGQLTALEMLERQINIEHDEALTFTRIELQSARDVIALERAVLAGRAHA